MGPSMPIALLLLLDAEHVRYETDGVELWVLCRTDDEELDRIVRLTKTTLPATCPASALKD